MRATASPARLRATSPNVVRTTYTSTGGSSSVRDAAITGMVNDMWSQYDANNNGVLDRSEAIAMIRQFLKAFGDGGAVSESAMNVAFDAIDVNRNGTVDKAEMNLLILKVLDGGSMFR